MRKFISIFILVLLLLQSTSKLWIVLSFYIQQEVIAKTKCINRFDLIPICKGQCYLDKQLKNNDKQERSLADVKVKEVQLYLSFGVEFKFSSKSLVLQSPIPCFQKANDLNCYIANVFRPPEYLSFLTV